MSEPTTQDTEQILDVLITSYLNQNMLTGAPNSREVRLYLAGLWKQDILEWAGEQAEARYEIAYYPPSPSPDSDPVPTSAAVTALSETEGGESENGTLPEEVSSDLPPPVAETTGLVIPAPLPADVQIGNTTVEPDSQGKPLSQPSQPSPEATPAPANGLEAIREKAAETAYALRKEHDNDFIAGRKNFEWLLVEVMKAHKLPELAARSATSRGMRRAEGELDAVVIAQTSSHWPVERRNGHAGNGKKAEESPLHAALRAHIERAGSMKPEPAWEIASQFSASKDEARAAVAEVEESLGIDKRSRLANREQIAASSRARHNERRLDKNGIAVLD